MTPPGQSGPQAVNKDSSRTTPTPGGLALTPTGEARGAGSSAAPSPAAEAWFTLTLGSGCVVPGGTQTLTAQTRAGYTVAFNSRYVDGKGGDAHGGYGVLAADSQGVVRSTWTVALTTPAGPVEVDAGTANGGPPTVTRRTFTVAAHC